MLLQGTNTPYKKLNKHNQKKKQIPEKDNKKKDSQNHMPSSVGKSAFLQQFNKH